MKSGATGWLDQRRPTEAHDRFSNRQAAEYTRFCQAAPFEAADRECGYYNISDSRYFCLFHLRDRSCAFGPKPHAGLYAARDPT
jgi:hypothetical protein